MKVWTDRKGQPVTGKEFLQRWVEGMKLITPLQQTKVSLMGAVLILIGVIIGLVVTFTTRVWWLFIILLGSLLLTGVTFLGTWQKYSALKKINDMIQEGGLNLNEKESTN